uniref:Uncharacterized protein n=1 Tax=Stomoxys calcitrans TaxID=35570 RepID=A0A1I8Q810_STOCA
MDLYYLPASAPCRAVAMTAEALGLKINKIYMNLQAGDHLKPEFIKINPQHTVPTLVDGDFVIWESRAIMTYLVEKYGKVNDALYPACPRMRAVINQRLYFDMGHMYKTLGDYYYAMRDKQSADPVLYKNIEVAMRFFNSMLEGKQYAAGGDSLTLADLSLFSTVSSFDAMIDFDFSKFPNVAKWYTTLKGMVPGAAENWAGCMELKKSYDSLKSSL